MFFLQYENNRKMPLKSNCLQDAICYIIWNSLYVTNNIFWKTDRYIEIHQAFLRINDRKYLGKTYNRNTLFQCLWRVVHVLVESSWGTLGYAYDLDTSSISHGLGYLFRFFCWCRCSSYLLWYSWCYILLSILNEESIWIYSQIRIADINNLQLRWL